ncbi:7-cyano-7-deazaguanine/7-aminomethyl-7-deazaguanine transporter [Halopseudomonas bauzanensis]|uniref:7-cyano-7-deazaguanine/7-aminomethyl-7- deazaguanine transporter n=1 Tax=Halopseudomonas bauzanensis TaxID=653930 RepID=UPI002554C644|nr:7-cyano-7-deazaguanine/7-aminomethyl-7-deazaguanine transporter [Halopseudomonas bauzanensis]
MNSASPSRLRMALSCLIAFHILIVIASNFLVQLPITLFGLHTTWGAFSFPFIFLATDLTVRLLGKQAARRVIARVMLPALVVSYVLSVLFQEAVFRGVEALTEFNLFVLRISVASFLAYVVGQLLDIQVFDRLRKLPQWWIAPTTAMIVGNLIDTFVFFSVAFWRSTNEFMAANWIEIAAVDYVIKVAISVMLFVPLYGLVLNAILRLLAGRPAATAG